MKVVRKGVFETNSSSVHSLTIVTKEEYDKLDSTDSFIYQEKIYSFEEAKKIVLEEDWLSSEEIEETQNYDYENWEWFLMDHGFERKEDYGGGLETFEEYFTTPSGDKMVAFGYFGRDC